MPIKWVLYWQANQGATVNTQILAEVSQCIESINGVKGGRWKSTLTYYKPIQRDQTMQLPAEITKDMMGISLQEQPNKYYFFIPSQRIVLEAESMIQTIMEKLQSYRSRISANFESGFLWMLFNVFEEVCVCKAAPDILKALSELKGFQYQFGDFQVRVGKIVPINSDILRGIVMEIEYLPISSLEKSRQVMEDFVDMWKEIVSKRSLPGKFEQVEPNFAEYGLPDRYSSQHTVIQYAVVMNQLLAPVRN